MKTLIKIILAIGNYMNGASTRGGAYGFTLDTLSKLQDTKSSTGKITLLRYVALLIDRKFPHLKNLSEEFPEMESACKGTR